MTYWLFFTIFVLGLAIGSFINALEYRLGTKLSVIKGRSICPKCKKQIAWYDNIPLISFIVLRGKCRQCKKQISWQYPVVELLTGLSFVAVAWKTFAINDFIVRAQSRTILSLVCLFFITFCLILVALHDQKTSYVLSGYVYAGIVATLMYLAIKYTGAWTLSAVWAYVSPNLLATLLAVLPFAALYLVSRGKWMGAGDIEIAALLGLLLGWPNVLVALYFAFVVGSVWGLAKVYLLKNAGFKSEIPFAPFLIAGIFFAFLFAEQLVSLYVKIFLG